MNKRVTAFAISLMLLLLTACRQEEAASQGSEPSESSGGSAPSASLPPASSDAYLNLDALEQYGLVTGTSFDCKEAELREWQQEAYRTDYAEVARRFVEEQLDGQLSVLDSVDGTYNPRRVTAVTAEGKAYALILNKWYNYGGIWTVGSYTEYEGRTDQGAVAPDGSVKYELLDVDSAETTVQDWARPAIDAGERKQDYLIVNGTVYILLTASAGESVELLGIYGDDNRIGVRHADSANVDGERYGDNPYVLVKVRSPVSEIVFSQYSRLQKEHPSLYIP